MNHQFKNLMLGSVLSIGVAVPALSSEVIFTEIPAAQLGGGGLKVSENGVVAFRDADSFYKWSETDGLTVLGPTIGAYTQTVPHISNDGQTVSFNGVLGWGTTVVHKDGVMQELSRADIIGSSLSADGNSIGGSLYGSGSNGAGGPIAVLDLVDGAVESDESTDYAGYEVKNFSADGNVQLAATIGTNMFSSSPAYLINSDGTRQQVATNVQGIKDLSGDGLTVVGQSFECVDFSFNCTVKWSPSGYTELGMFFAGGMNFDGSVIVGYQANGDDAGGKIWDAANGIRDISDVLAGRGIDISAWTNLRLNDISDNGYYIVGAGIDLQGNAKGFLISVIPQCTSGL